MESAKQSSKNSTNTISKDSNKVELRTLKYLSNRKQNSINTSHKRLQSMHGNINSNSLTNLNRWDLANNKYLKTLSELNDIVPISNEDNTNEEFAFYPSNQFDLETRNFTSQFLTSDGRMPPKLEICDLKRSKANCISKSGNSSKHRKTSSNQISSGLDRFWTTYDINSGHKRSDSVESQVMQTNKLLEDKLESAIRNQHELENQLEDYEVYK